jgi:uncharacterized membrane protein YkoI
MKRLLSVLCSVVVICTFAVSSLSAASSRENQRLHERKITKNEAQHLVLKKYPGAIVKKCELMDEKGQSVWMLQVVKPGARDATDVKVDGRSGKILP